MSFENTENIDRLKTTEEQDAVLLQGPNFLHLEDIQIPNKAQSFPKISHK